MVYHCVTMLSAIRLPGALQRHLNGKLQTFMGGGSSDFLEPRREAALLPPNSVSWRIWKNPISLFVGGTAAVILELAEPGVRAGVWQHSTFRQNPLGRLQRTGRAAMVTVYGARSVAEPMIARVVRMHAGIQGKTPAGSSYSASDPRLLTWVHATAAYCFAQAYSRYVEALSAEDFNGLYREGAPIAQLYGAVAAPTSVAQMQSLFAATHATLEASPVVFEFLRIMRETSALPRPVAWLQPLLVRAAVQLIPDWIRE
ncbi:MAG TPA: oxygenase MpaB family protein, partial [Steroidobacteraceae bacterium]